MAEKRILLAEDDTDLGNILSQYLSMQGFEVTLARDGEAAWESFQDKQADICVLDVMMPKMDGYEVLNSEEAAKVGDIFVSVTGDINVIGEVILKNCKDKTIIANAGHFNAEIDLDYLSKNSKSKRKVRPFTEEYVMKDGRRIYLLAEGRLVNLSAAEGHPASVMDMSFANQALSVEYIYKNSKDLACRVYAVPEDIDKNIAEMKLKSMGICIDKLTPEQEEYLKSWEMGT